MERIKEIEDEITRLQERLIEVRGTQTEVYSRIVGYYRSVRNWNRGKRSEYEIRRVFDAPKSIEPKEIRPRPAVTTDTIVSRKPVEYRCFYRESCPNCPPVKQFLEDSGLSGEMIDVDAHPDAAVEYGVMAAPTVILFDDAGRETTRVHNVSRLKSILSDVELFVGA